MENTRELEVAFSLNRQDDFTTPLAPANITHKLPFREFAPHTDEFRNIITDRQHYGKGHSHSTRWSPLQRIVPISTRTYDMTQLSALWIFGFTLGDVVASQPDDVGAPTVWDYLFTFKDPSTDLWARFTSLVERYGGTAQHIIDGLAMNSCTLTANRDDHATLGFEGMARGKATDATALPALSTGQQFFKLIHGLYSFGAVGAPVNHTTEVQQFSLTLSQNLSVRHDPSETDEDRISRLLIGDQTAQGSIQVYMDETIRTLYNAKTESELSALFKGPNIILTFDHEVEIKIPRFNFGSETHVEDDQIGLLTLALNEDSILKDDVTPSPFISVRVRTDVDYSATLLQTVV